MEDDTREFTISQDDSKGTSLFTLRSDYYDPLSTWLAPEKVEVSNAWAETDVLGNSFVVPLEKEEAVAKKLIQCGYKQIK